MGIIEKFYSFKKIEPDPAESIAKALRYIPGNESKILLQKLSKHKRDIVASTAKESLSMLPK